MFPYFYDWHRRTDIPLSTPVESRGSILADTDLVAAVVPLLALLIVVVAVHAHVCRETANSVSCAVGNPDPRDTKLAKTL